MLVELQNKWQKMGFQEQTPIQKASYEPLQAGTNQLLVSPTGSGKTVAYLLPLLERIEVGQGNQLLIVLPSQELAHQIAQVTRGWAQPLGIKVGSAIGGANIERQLEKLKAKPEILIGTPGRIQELIQRKKIKAHLLKMVVLDEVDQLVQAQDQEMVFMKRILRALDQAVQLVFVSATGHQSVAQLQSEITQEFGIIDCLAEDTSRAHLAHHFMVVAKRKRTEQLRRLGNVAGFRALVFFKSLSDLGAASDKLFFERIPHATLASDQSNVERKGAIEKFRAQEVPFLLTTEVSARGLDIEDLAWVINMEVPHDATAYAHRSGRVGRMGKAGHVLTFIEEPEKSRLEKVIDQPVDEWFLYGGQVVNHAQFQERLDARKAENAERPKAQRNSRKTERPQKDKGLAEDVAPVNQTTRKKKVKTKKRKNKGAPRNKG